MKRIKKAFAILLAIALVSSFAPMIAMGAASDLSVILIDGVDMFSEMGDVNAAAVGEPLVGIEIPIPVNIDRRFYDAGRAGLLTATGGTDMVVLHIPATDVGDLLEDMPLNAARGLSSNGIEAWTNQSLADGDIILVISGNHGTGGELIHYGAFLVTLVTPSTGELEGLSDLESIILNVKVPTNLNFTLNPFQSGVDTEDSATERYDNQLSATDFELDNDTAGVAVFVGFDLEVTGETGVAFVANRAALNRDDVEERDKDIFFAALAASDITATPKFVADNVADEVATMSDAMVPFAPATNGESADAEFAFVLEEEGVGDKADEAIFRFYAEMNTYAGWAAGDVTVDGTYILTALRPATAEAFEFADDGHNLVAGGGGEEWGHFTVAVGVPEQSTAQDAWNSDNPLQIQFPPGPGPVTVSSTVAGLASNPWPSINPGNGWTYEAGTGRFILERIPGSGATVVVRVGDITLTININGR